MKRQRQPQAPRRPAAPEEDEEEAREQQPTGKRSRFVPQFHSESEGDSGDSQSDSEGSSEEEDDNPSEGEDEGPSLGELVAMRQDGSTTPAAMKARARAAKAATKAGAFKRTGKHKPVEMSSKRPVPVLREALPGGKRESRDPRFESLSGGQYQEDRFKQRYAFLYDEKLPQERADLKAALSKAKGAARRAELQAQLQRVEQQLRSEQARRKREGVKQGIKAKERQAVREGKRPFFLKKSEQRRLELLAKYEELKAAGPGKLEAFLAKRRRKNASKDHRHLPAARRGGDE